MTCTAAFDSQSSFVYEAVDGVPPLPLSVRREQLEERQGEAARLMQLLLTSSVDPGTLLQLGVTAEHHAAQEYLQRGDREEKVRCVNAMDYSSLCEHKSCTAVK